MQVFVKQFSIPYFVHTTCSDFCSSLLGLLSFKMILTSYRSILSLNSLSTSGEKTRSGLRIHLYIFCVLEIRVLVICLYCLSD